MRVFLGILVSGFILLAVSSPGAAAEKTTFTVTATYCANPWDGHEGPDVGGAMRAADRTATEKCYPYQIHLDSEYETGEFDGCKKGYWGSMVTASYSCASDRGSNSSVSNCEPPPASRPCKTSKECPGGRACMAGSCVVVF